MRLPVVVAIVVSVVGLAGCVSLEISPPEIHEYVLDYPPPSVEGTPLPVILRMAPFGAVAAYDRQAIVYRSDSHATGTYFYDRWMAHPASMIADLLTRDLTASGLYQAVQQGASALPSDYHLSGEVEEIAEHVTGEGCSAHLELRVLLARARTLQDSRVAFQKTYSAQESCSGEGSRGFVEAMSRAMEEISTILQKDLYRAVSEDCGTAAP